MPPFWIADERFRLGIMLRPRGNDWLDDEAALLRGDGANVVVSALTPEESVELGLENEANACGQAGITFILFPIEDRSVPASETEFESFAARPAGLLRRGKSLANHCRAGIGRSSMIAAALLIKNGYSWDATFRAIEQARGRPVPDTPEQLAWMERRMFRRESQ